MPTPILLTVNHVEASDDMEWSLTPEEILGGTGRATLTVQDRTNTWEPQPHWDVKAEVRSTGHVLFRGEIIRTPLELPTGMPWRKWKLDCVDYNDQKPQRLIGALDGVTWQDVDGLGDYVNIDINAHSLRTDRLTIQHLFDKYFRVDGQAVDTDEFVGEYLVDFPMLSWQYSDLQSALEELASQIAQNLQFWLDPDLKFHWVAIPAWQELAQQMAGLGGDPNSPNSLSALMLPEANPGLLPISPYNLNNDEIGAFKVGFRELSFTFDGHAMPEQVYVQGGTGFVYNAPAIDPVGETIFIDPQGYGSLTTEKFRLTFLSSTKIWQKQANGLISSTFENFGPGGPYDVVFIRVPFNSANGKGGHFWQMTSGPKQGFLVDNDTNYFGYGSITVEKYVETVVEPEVGVGGSGWVNDAVQDLNKRQAYLRAPVSTTRAKRDALGGQALYRGSVPTLRGSCKVSGVDGWRAGQLVQITDSRLPATLNGKYFVIQRVSTTLIPGADVREYTIDWGDGPTSRYTMQPPKGGGDVRWPPPVNRVVIDTFDLAPGPNSTQTITAQLTDKAGAPWRIPGKVVKWTLEVYNSAGTLITGQGSLIPEVSATDSEGRARTVLTTGAMTGLVYFIFADVPVE